MKNFFKLLFVLITLSIVPTKTEALTFEQAFANTNRTPMVVLIYAPWADNYQNYTSQFNIVKNKMSNTYNFVELDIATKEAKAFNNIYNIYPKLPYILMIRNSGKITRYIKRECASSASCIEGYLRSFIQ